MSSFLESFWFLAGYPVFLLGAIGAGYFIAHRQYKRQINWKPSGTENAIISFYGLLLSFSLYSSGNAYRERTSLVHQHIDAVAAIFREASFADDSTRQEINSWIKALLLAKLSHQGINSEEEILREVETDSLYNSMLARIHRLDSDPRSATHRYYFDKINAAIALDYRIQYSALERTPAIVIALLVTGSLLVGLLVGFTNGFTDRPQILVPTIFFLLTALTISTILDMDNPAFGIIRPPSNNYENFLRSIPVYQDAGF